MDNKRLGEIGEILVAEHLRDREYKVLDRNYRTKYGEIDIVAVRNDEVHFVEVKTRTSEAYGLPCEAVDKKKQAHFKKAVRIYIESRRMHTYKVSLDVAEVEVRLIENCI